MDTGWICLGRLLGTVAKVFGSKHGPAVRLPKHIPVKRKGLDSFRIGDEIVLPEKQGTMLGPFELPASLPNELGIADRASDRPQERNAARLKKRRRG